MRKVKLYTGFFARIEKTVRQRTEFEVSGISRSERSTSSKQDVGFQMFPKGFQMFLQKLHPFTKMFRRVFWLVFQIFSTWESNFFNASNSKFILLEMCIVSQTFVESSGYKFSQKMLLSCRWNLSFFTDNLTEFRYLTLCMDWDTLTNHNSQYSNR